jgi:hypothetical protein
VLSSLTGYFYTGGKSYPTAADERQGAAVVLGDLDGDDDLDLVLTSDEDIHFRRGTYYWTWSSNPAYTFWTYRYTASKIPRSSTRVFFNDGSGGFTPAPYAVPYPRTSSGRTDTLRGDALALGDIDDDGDLDLIVSSATMACETSYTYTFKLTPFCFYGLGISYSYSFTWFWNDLADHPATRVLLNDGKGRFTNETDTRMPSVDDGDLFAAQASTLVDVDGDGDLDLLLTGDGAHLRDMSRPEFVGGAKTRVLLNDGTGRFSDGTSTWVPPPRNFDDWGAVSLATGDLDGDGRPDLVFSTDRTLKDLDDLYRSSTRVFRNLGDGFADVTATALPPVRTDGQGDLWRGVQVVLADANTEPGLDIVIVDEAVVVGRDPLTGLYAKSVSSTRVLRNDGSGRFTDDTRAVMPRSGEERYRGSAIALGDLDEDGDDDMLITTDLSCYWPVGQHSTRWLDWE